MGEAELAPVGPRVKPEDVNVGYGNAIARAYGAAGDAVGYRPSA